MPIQVCAIEHDPSNSDLIHDAIEADRDLCFEAALDEVRALRDKDIAIVNLADLTSHDLARVQLLGVPPGVVLICVSSSAGLLESVRSKSAAVLQEPLSRRELSRALGIAKDVLLVQRMESLSALLQAYSRVEDAAESVTGLAGLPAAENIEWIESDGNYVKIHTSEGCEVLRMTMAQIEMEFRHTQIVRGHRKWLVNLARVSSVHFDMAGSLHLALDGGVDLVVGRTYRETIRERLRTVSGSLPAQAPSLATV